MNINKTLLVARVGFRPPPPPQVFLNISETTTARDWKHSDFSQNGYTVGQSVQTDKESNSQTVVK